MTKELELVFKTEQDKEYIVRIRDPKEPLVKADCTSAMAKIISANVFDPSIGRLVTAVEARIKTVDVQAVV